MQIDIVLLFGVVASIVGSMFIALLCSLPGFVLDFFHNFAFLLFF